MSKVVNLLNHLYTIFDSIIDSHDVCKVETIGDSYLCVSGLPNRNGHEHIKEICSILFLGSVVAAIVGLAMPRYCLFGDTVNTASRIQSNGKPGMIHLSLDAKNLLFEVGGFEVTSRGELIIKVGTP
ncbi:unnamed protein product [Angiostrongylus costaricensis]|uniref:Guanylate cyclase domain-containing protein n=1 Tax=Angiostrongylus costaricensis TaxID=334426 RepID=A0A3P7I9V0_ANGCS|nr:unnamed protein product [Angiostrongylus costaricensis]